MDDWKSKSLTTDNALNALLNLQGDADAIDLIRCTMLHFDEEIRQLKADNARLRARESLPRPDDNEHHTMILSVENGSYTRRQPYVIVEWTCVVCGKKHSQKQLPGNKPKYCPPPPGEKMSDCNRKMRRERMRRRRLHEKQLRENSL